MRGGRGPRLVDMEKDSGWKKFREDWSRGRLVRNWRKQLLGQGWESGGPRHGGITGGDGAAVGLWKEATEAGPGMWLRESQGLPEMLGEVMGCLGRMEGIWEGLTWASGCLQDTLDAYPCGSDHTPSPMASRVPLEATPVLEWARGPANSRGVSL